MRFEGEHLVVVGGSSGIGLETARLALAAGASVTIAGRSEDRLRRATEDLGSSRELGLVGARRGATRRRRSPPASTSATRSPRVGVTERRCRGRRRRATTRASVRRSSSPRTPAGTAPASGDGSRARGI
jgi:NAD(P)-dependent dehydrogenase (short-subunit alcohol dehydrogenase family)